jgi:hypothetical protein
MKKVLERMETEGTKMENGFYVKIDQNMKNALLVNIDQKN